MVGIQWPSLLKRRSQFSFASLLNGRTWTQIRSPLGIFYTLIFDSRSQLEDSVQLGLGLGLGKAGSKFQKGWPSLANNLLNHLAKSHLMIEQQKQRKEQELSHLVAVCASSRLPEHHPELKKRR